MLSRVTSSKEMTLMLSLCASEIQLGGGKKEEWFRHREPSEQRL